MSMTPPHIYYPSQTEIVGFKVQSDKLIGWLEDGHAKINVTVVVGMAGQGKTTLVKQIYDNENVIGKSDCLWLPIVHVAEALRRNLATYLFYKMDLELLTNRVKKHLNKKRYVLFFNDVWSKQFWKEIEHIIGHNEIGSRIIITTRNKEVAKNRNMSSVVDVEVHEM